MLNKQATPSYPRQLDSSGVERIKPRVLILIATDPIGGPGKGLFQFLKYAPAPLVLGLLSDSAVKGHGLFHFPAVQEMIASHEANRIDGTDRLIALLNLEIWSRLYLDVRAPDDVTNN